MTFTRQSALAALFAATLAATCGASAATPAERPDAATASTPDGPDGRGHGDGRRDDFGPHGPGAPGPGMPFHRLHGLDLSEAQQDKLFAITHAEAPLRRDQDKALRKAEQGLDELARAERFDDARAVALTRELGQAVAAQTLLRMRSEAKVLAVLTPEQRERLRQPRRHGRDDGPDERRPDAQGASKPAAGAQP